MTIAMFLAFVIATLGITVWSAKKNTGSVALRTPAPLRHPSEGWDLPVRATTLASQRPQPSLG